MNRLLALLLVAGCKPDPSPPDRSGDDTELGDTDDTAPGVPPTAWQRQELQTPASLSFTELNYHPGDDEDLEWLELHNPMALDMDLSGWSLEGGVSFAFDEGTVVPAGGYLVVAADPSRLEVDALGPYDGRLSNEGERIDLRSSSGRLIDALQYRHDDPWPVHPDGSGLSLAKRSPNLASDHAENWTFSAQPGGTPGAENGLDPDALPLRVVLVDEDADWLHDLSGVYPAEDWAQPEHDDGAWESGQAPFFAGGSEEPVDATAWATADNYFALYLGQADGSELRLVGEDTDGSWTTVEEMDLQVEADDHLYIAAWELTGDSSSPQMTIAEVELPEGVVGTDSTGFEWVLGPVNANPGGLPANAPPDEQSLLSLISAGGWQLPAVESTRTSSPWGGSVGGWFTDDALFIWADTFGSNSITNSDDTFVVFRSIEPLRGPAGNMELDEVPTTVTFRTHFAYQGEVASTELQLDCSLDDGAVFYLNGVEVLRENMPSGTVDETTLASAAVDDAELFASLPSGALVQGDNVLAVELHQADDPDDDLLFACTLVADISTQQAAPTVVFNELSAGAEWVELLNLSPEVQDLDGLTLSTSAGEAFALEGTLDVGEFLVLEPGMEVWTDDRLFLSSEDAVLDVVRVTDGPRAREEASWWVPAEPSPGEANRIEHIDAIVINEVQYNRADEEWVELTNRGTDEVDLSGWQLVDALAFDFPEGTVLAPGDFVVVASEAAALAATHPQIEILGDFAGGLGNGSDRILLLDALGNPADEVHYFDGGRWPAAADGGGASLELRDPFADNAVAEAWAASAETSDWVDVSFRGVAEGSVVGPDGVWEELVLGLLDAGEVLIDDLSVVQDPDSNPVELVQNGSFENEDHWRLLGNHGGSEVIADPEDADNTVLRLHASGGAGHMHNHAETTLTQPVQAREVEVSFRAKWVWGSNQLHSRLYFNRLPRTTLLERAATSGTPGAPNSVLTNSGPTYSGLRQGAVVPSPQEPVVISIVADDPDGIDAMRLWSSVDGASFDAVTMADEGGIWTAELDGQAAGSVVQFYIEGEDTEGAVSTFPAAGPDSNALYIVDDGLATGNGRHNLRILMTPENEDWLHDELNLMSNGRVGATVVYNESEVFYDVGIRLKGSQRGRPQAKRIGYGIRFNDEQPFRGSHTSVLIDRSEGVGYGQREMLLNLMMTRAGSVTGEYNDVVHLLGPVAAYNGSAELQLDRFSNLVLDAQFENGADGTRFEYELIYYPTTTHDGTDEGYKRPQPDSVIGVAITDLGSDKEHYRWNWLIKNNREEDGYDEIIEMCQTFSGGDFPGQANDIIDVEQWLRAFAFATLSGATDQYGGAGSQHNAQFYVRPADGRVLYLPHDLDFFSSSTMPVVGNGDLSRLLQDPVNLRSYYGHLQDIIQTSYNAEYLGPWCEQLGELLPGQNFDAHCRFVDDRAAWILTGSSESVTARFPEEDFRITTNDGEDFSVPGQVATLEGRAWVDVRGIHLDGQPLDLVWVDSKTWQVEIPVSTGENAVALQAVDLHGQPVGSDEVVVTSGI
jgi:hypothetical protein